MNIRSARRCGWFAALGLMLPALAVADELGSSNVTFSGAYEEQFEGSATHMEGDSPFGHYFLLSLFRYNTDTDFTMISLMLKGANPGPGTYDLVNRDPFDTGDSEPGFEVTALVQEGELMSIAELSSGPALAPDGSLNVGKPYKAGELVIEAASDGELTGKVHFEGNMAYRGNFESTIDFTFDATFRAVEAAPEDMPGMFGAAGQ